MSFRISRGGFSLLLSLCLLACILLLALSAAAVLRVTSRETGVDADRRRLRSAALAAAEMAVGQLSTSVGGDAAFTYVDAEGGLRVGRNGTRAGWGESNYLLGDGVRVEVRVEDLSQRWDERAAADAGQRATAWARSQLGRQALCARGASASPSAAAALALELGDRTLYHAANGSRPEQGTTWGGRGLLTDPVRGGWRRNWSSPTLLAGEFGPELATRLLAPPAAFAADPAAGLPPTTLASGPFRLAHAPVLVDFRLSMGFFNSRSDGRHRLRFHGSGRWWNPSAAPLLADADGNLCLIEVEGAPEVEVRNLDARSGFVTYLDDCPQEDFGIFTQGLREQGLWLWGGIADARTYGMSRRGLLPGEVYGFIAPSPTTQPQGLARLLTRTTWRMDTASHPDAWVRPSPEVMRPTDRIAINVRFRGPMAVKLRPAVGAAPADRAIRDYPSAPQVVLANIPFPDFLIETTGADYSREDSAGYTLGERRACLRLALRERPLAQWLQGAREGRLLKTHWDLADPADAAEWVIPNPLLAVLETPEWPTTSAQSELWDAQPNAHAAATPGAFARLVVRDLPAAPLMSVAAVHALLPESDLRWAPALDAAFLAAPASLPGHSENPRLVVAERSSSAPPPDLRSPDVGAQLLVDGPFNVNSIDPDAWERLLAAPSGQWVADIGGPLDAAPLSGAWLCTLPSGAQLAPFGAATPLNLPDVLIAEAGEGSRRLIVAQQSVRALPPATIRRWAEAMVALQPTHGWPYPSLEAWARSGVLERSMAAAGVNDCLGLSGMDGPAALRPAHLLRAYGPMLTVRGDTFRILARATDPQGRRMAEVEWVVQRVPELHALPSLGRRFRIIRARIPGG